MAYMTEGEYRYNMTIKMFGSDAEPAFESAAQQELVWGRQWGCPNDVGQLRMVLMHRPGAELNVRDPSKRLDEIGAFGDPDHGWYWRGDEMPSLEALQAEHDALVAAIRAEGVEIVFLDEVAPERMKSCYTRDSVIAVNGGAIVTRLGPKIRRGEELPVTRTLAGLGMPILRTINGSGLMEGGSFCFLNQTTAVVGLSTRINAEGARQLEEVLNAQGVELLKAELTGYRLHIDGMLVMIDVATAIVNPTQIPFWLLERMVALGIRTVEVHPDDGDGILNCLAIRPGRVIMAQGVSGRTKDRLDAIGVEIVEVPYSGMYLGGGGVHCSTAPLIRDAIS